MTREHLKCNSLTEFLVSFLSPYPNLVRPDFSVRDNNHCWFMDFVSVKSSCSSTPSLPGNLLTPTHAHTCRHTCTRTYLASYHSSSPRLPSLCQPLSDSLHVPCISALSSKPGEWRHFYSCHSWIHFPYESQSDPK